MTSALDPIHPTANNFQPPPTRRRWSLGELSAWAVILTVVAYIAWRAAVSQFNLAAGAAPDTTLPMMSQYALGVSDIYAKLGDVNALKGTNHTLLAQLDSAAKAPEDQFRVAIVAGELESPAEAQSRMIILAAQTPALDEDARTAAAIYDGQPVPPQTWAAFQTRYGWFSDLLASSGKPAGDPLRSKALARAYWTVGLLLAACAGAALLAVAGLVLLIIALVRLAQGKIPRAFSPMEPPGIRADRRTYALGMALYLGGSVILGRGLVWLQNHLFAKALPPNSVIWLSMLGLVAAFAFGVTSPLLFGQTWGQYKAALGLHCGRGIWREIGGGLVGYLAGMPLMAVGLVLVVILSKITGIKGTHPIVQELQGSPWELVMVFFLACVFAPISEELMFRGALFAHLRERFAWWLAAPMVAVVFALMHPQSWIALPVLGAIAVVFAGIREWRGSIIGCMAAHAVHNGLALAFAVTLLR